MPDASGEGLKPPAQRLYGRTRGHALRARQRLLMETLLPRLRWPDAPFGNDPREIWLEVGAGSFEHAEAIAAANPGIGLIASEVFENGIASLLSRLAPEGVVREGVAEGAQMADPPANLRVFDDDARSLIDRLPDSALGRLFLMFPDPWPKARHAKRRFVHPARLPAIARVLRPGAAWRIASDDPVYQEWVEEVIAGQDLFELSARLDAPPADWPRTRYEAKALAAGRTPRYWTLICRGTQDNGSEAVTV